MTKVKFAAPKESFHVVLKNRINDYFERTGKSVSGNAHLYTKAGIDVVGKGKVFGQQLKDDYTAKNYHQPSDNYDAATWTMEGAVYQLKLLFRVGKRLASETNFPEWKDGSEFKGIRVGKK